MTETQSTLDSAMFSDDHRAPIEWREAIDEEVTQGTITPGESYRIAMFAQTTSTTRSTDRHSTQHWDTGTETADPELGPPVHEGEIRDVSIESLGDQGDGIAKVERGYVVIVPETQPGEQPTIEIEEVQQNVAFASVIASDRRTL